MAFRAYGALGCFRVYRVLGWLRASHQGLGTLFFMPPQPVYTLNNIPEEPPIKTHEPVMEKM